MDKLCYYIKEKIDDGTDVAELMRIFTETDAYDFEKFPKISARKKQFKESEGGKEKMVSASITTLNDEDNHAAHIQISNRMNIF